MDSRHIVSGVLGLVIGLSLGVGTVMTATVTRSIGGSVDPNVGFGAGRPYYEGPFRDFYKRTVRSTDWRDNVLRNVPAVAEYYRSLSEPTPPLEPVRAAAPSLESSILCGLALDVANSVRIEMGDMPSESQYDANQALGRVINRYCQ